MIKKLVTTGAAAGLLLASAVPAFASYYHPSGARINQSNSGVVVNKVEVEANTGENNTGGIFGGGNLVWTGDARVSGAVENAVNQNYVQADCRCAKVKSVRQSNGGFVVNSVEVEANAGENETGGFLGGHNFVKTGAATVSGAVSSVVNSNVVLLGAGAP